MATEDVVVKTMPITKNGSEIFVYLKSGVCGGLGKGGCRLCCLVGQLGRRSALGLPRSHPELQPWPPQGTQPSPHYAPSQTHHQKKQSIRNPSEPHQNLIRTPSEPHQNPMTNCNRRLEASTDMMAILPNPFLRLWGPCLVFLAPRSGSLRPCSCRTRLD